MSKDKELLKRLFGDDIEEKISSDDFDVDEFVNEHTEKQKKQFREVFENDSEFKNNIYRKQKAKDYGTIDQRLKKFGLDSEEISQLSLTEKFDKLQAKYNEDVKSASKKGVEEYQSQLHEANQELQKYKEELIPQLKQENEEKMNQFYVDNALARDLANTDKGYFREDLPAETINEIIETNLRRNYDLRLEDGSLQVYVKGTDEKPQNEKKTGVLTYKEIKDQIAEQKGLKKKNNSGQQDPGTPPSNNNNGSSVELQTTGYND